MLLFNARTGETEEVERVIKSDAEWKKILTPEQFKIMRQKGTERPFAFQCPLPPKGGKAIYQCVGCGTDLFSFDAKFESGTGWPSFWQPVSDLNIKEEADDSFGMHRVEVFCARCGAHLGHVFDDGPPPSGKRYCVNAIALKLADYAGKSSLVPKAYPKALFAAGCFWGVEAAFRQVKGVISVRSGYTGGNFKNPTYKDVCSGKTGHAEAVEIEYDPLIVSYGQLLDVFWRIHDPTTLNKQGPDIGDQYRSAIFVYTPEQKSLALDSKKKLELSKAYSRPVVTEITAAGEFYPAEEYHQRYYEKHGIKGCALRVK
ncbi:MAG: bifunctional methionine sulfoxide reductase B/A protein [Candidatus Omnitrophica bacterium]|nr:bifunctional methionine sulfoxide reductase B/A protein [Candidatus Omnitrophota bacterium]